MSVENKQVRGDASVSRNVNAGGNARVQGNMHVGHNLRVDGTVEAQNIKAANKGLFLDEAQLKARYPQPEEGWFAGVGSSSPFVVYIARNGEWQRTTGTFSVDVDMDSYNQRIDELESQVAELIEIILSGGGGNVVNVRVSVEGHGSVTGSGLYQIGNSVTLTATAASGYHFVEWQDAEGNTIAGAGATYTFEATESVTLKAVFAVSYYTVSATPNDSTLGSVSVSPAVPAGQSGYNYGTQITLTATASTTTAQRPYYFVGWSDGVTDSQRTILMNRNIELQANFAQEQEAIANVATAGSGEIDVTVLRGETQVQATNVRIGDVITLTATGITHKPSALVDGGGTAIACEFSQDGKEMTYSFRYDGTQSLTFTATFGGEVIEVKRTISVTPKESSWGTAKIMVGEADKGPSTQVVAGTQVTLVATANSGFTFDHWQFNGSNVSTESTFYVTMPDSNVSYMAVFRHSEAPDFYYGAVVPDATSGNAYDKANVISELTKGWIAGNTVNTPEITIASGRKFIVLYNSEKVTPTYMKLGEDLSDPDKYEEFDSTGINNPRNFNQGVVAETYTSFEGKVTVATGDVQYFQVTFTKQ
jgi:hypothetical protein